MAYHKAHYALRIVIAKSTEACAWARPAPQARICCIADQHQYMYAYADTRPTALRPGPRVFIYHTLERVVLHKGTCTFLWPRHTVSHCTC